MITVTFSVISDCFVIDAYRKEFRSIDAFLSFVSRKYPTLLNWSFREVVILPTSVNDTEVKKQYRFWRDNQSRYVQAIID